jgi:hypothetical protein
LIKFTGLFVYPCVSIKKEMDVAEELRKMRSERSKEIEKRVTVK